MQLLAGTLFVLSTVAVAAESTSPKSEKVTCCMVANGVVEHTDKDLKKIDEAVSQLTAARNSNDPKVLHNAVEIAYKSLTDVRQDETKNSRAMKALFKHLQRSKSRPKVSIA